MARAQASQMHFHTLHTPTSRSTGPHILSNFAHPTHHNPLSSLLSSPHIHCFLSLVEGDTASGMLASSPAFICLDNLLKQNLLTPTQSALRPLHYLSLPLPSPAGCLGLLSLLHLFQLPLTPFPRLSPAVLQSGFVQVQVH